MFVIYLIILPTVFGSFLNNDFISDYFNFKGVKYVSVFHCNDYESIMLAEKLINLNIRVQLASINDDSEEAKLKVVLKQKWLIPSGFVLPFECVLTKTFLTMASRLKVFDSRHSWMVIGEYNETFEASSELFVQQYFGHLNLSVNSDIAIAFKKDNTYDLVDVFNFGKIQGNPLEVSSLGIWSKATGLEIYLTEYKYYHRWDFHNLTLRSVSVILGKPMTVFKPELLTDINYNDDISAMTKISSIVLNTLRDMHNFRFNYTIADRWVGSPVRNSSLAVTNSLFWKQQDISCTCLRIFSAWLEWMDPLFPPVTYLETKFYYRIPSTGAGDYENRFLQPLSPTVWWCSLSAFGICGLILGIGAYVEKRSRPASYAFFTITAAACQQDFDDGDKLPDDSFASQGRRIVLFVAGSSSMLLYNYYTSSVVSWLLNAAPPTIANLDGLIHSDLELAFEDIGYTRSWLESPGFYYYSGFRWPKEDELRQKKVRNAQRTVELLQSADDGIKLVRKGGYAYHTEPYNANRRISRSFDQQTLCELGALQMMIPAPVYIMVQRHSPYREFFVWSLIRALERGHISYARRRISGDAPRCSGGLPRALSLGQAAPAFALLAYGALVSLLILASEIICHKYDKDVFI